MAEINLEVTLRKQIGKSKAKALRRANIIPAVVYGEKINFPISIDKTKFQRLMGSHAAENIIINLKITDEASSAKKSKEKDHPVLIKDIQYDPLKGSVIHVDFNEISLTKEITVKVPLIAKGEPIGVKQDGGVLSHQVWELDVKCLPKDLPEKIEVDVSNLKINDDIRIKDLKLAAGVVALQDLEMVVLSVVPPTKEEVAKPAEAEAVVTESVKQEPEVIKEKKEKEGETPEAAKEKPKEKAKE
jgi:large subunit ribosomal protein L25